MFVLRQAPMGSRFESVLVANRARRDRRFAGIPALRVAGVGGRTRVAVRRRRRAESMCLAGVFTEKTIRPCPGANGQGGVLVSARHSGRTDEWGTNLPRR